MTAQNIKREGRDSEAHLPAFLETDSTGAEEHYRQLMSLVSDYVYCYRLLPDGAQVLEWATGSLFSVLGWSLEEINSRDWSELVPPEDIDLTNDHIARLFTGGEAVVDHRLITRTGEMIRIRNSASLETLPQGQGARIYGALQDITARVQAEMARHETEARFQNLAEAMPQFVWISDKHGALSYINQQFVQYTGQTLTQIMDGGSVQSVHPEDVVEMSSQWQEAMRRQEPYTVEFRCRRAMDGAYRWYLCRVVPIRDEAGMLQQWIGTSTDIHEQKQAQEQMAALNAQLHRAMRETHHRVKNNLQMISALMEMEEDETKGTVPKSSLSRIRQNVSTLAMIHDLLTHEASVDTDDSSLASTDVMGQLLPLLQVSVGNRHIGSDIDLILLSTRHATALSLVVNELVNNAVKHGSSNIAVSLKRQAGRTTDANGHSLFALEVNDDGPGFPLDFNSQTAASTGLELINSITRWDLGGTIVYANRAEGGASIRLNFALPEPLD